MRPWILVFFVLTFSNSLFSQITNTRSGNWDDASAWSNNKVPTDTTNVILNYDISINTIAECKSIIANGKKVTVITGYKLNIGPHKLTVTPDIGIYTGCANSDYTSSPNCGLYTGRITGRIVSIDTATKKITFEIKRCNDANFNGQYYVSIFPNSGCANSPLNSSFSPVTITSPTFKITVTDNNMKGEKKYLATFIEYGGNGDTYYTPPLIVSY
ncbi:hypothetical protein [Ferruginibacter albus]|uniref:hypothetical protein n=1 Tax=Ferruginibacter albus TaxID=2875540 RepID=UPI001CC69175|nr:hypothetical protein [Ferruginibacter albus]UAY53423.1 hypothetical protein K9M53_07055 [Ferruginibacter albus]